MKMYVDCTISARGSCLQPATDPMAKPHYSASNHAIIYLLTRMLGMNTKNALMILVVIFN